MNTAASNKFNFFIPLNIEKGGENGQLVKISGVASTDAKDSDGETLIPAGFDFAPLLQSGFLNWNHQARTTSKAICGEPTSAKIINDGKDFFIEGVLYPNEEGKNVVELAETLQKHSPNRRLGFSIEGQATERDILNPKRVTKARITGVAITQSPKNPNTLMNIVKGEYANEFVDDSIELTQIQKSEEQSQSVLTVICSPSAEVRLKKVLQGFQENWEGEDQIISFDSKQELDKSIEVKEGPEQQQLDKAMMVDVDINPPSIEGVEKQKKLVNIIKKSEIYNHIYNKYTTSFEKAEQIYTFINQVKEQSMKIDNITPDVLQKAFDLLDTSINLTKGEDKQKSLDDYDKKDEMFKEGDDKKNNDVAKADVLRQDSQKDDDDDDEEFDKAMHCENMAKSLMKGGMSEDEVVKAMTSVGVSLTLAETSCANCIAQASEQKDGGDITVLSKGGEEGDLSKSNQFEHNLFIKLDEKFGAVGEILKSQTEQIDLLKKSNEAMENKLQRYEKTPNERKSATTAKTIERFEKSTDGISNIEVYDSRSVVDMRALSTRLFGECEMIKSNGGEDRNLEKAVADLEIAKSTDWKAISPRLRAMNIEIR